MLLFANVTIAARLIFSNVIEEVLPLGYFPRIDYVPTMALAHGMRVPNKHMNLIIIDMNIKLIERQGSLKVPEIPISGPRVTITAKQQPVLPVGLLHDMPPQVSRF